ncbi:MAG TPA: DUF3570 domain-containing protein [Gammaproteobacteria bacterium]|nr:DUF3570 domain-containing protein [Gammaproteobacteria bacterium]
MQLKKKNIAGLLSVATCSLLSGQAQSADDWNVDSAILFYSETDRVDAVEPVISGKKDLGDDEILSMKLVFDALTGSSANGAVPSTMVQTFTTPSGGGGGEEGEDEGEGEGGGSYQVAPNTTPLDPTFKDARAAFSMNWDKPVERDRRRNLGFNFSIEHDFTSLGVNGLWQYDSNQKNTSWTWGTNIELDSINPIGGAPEPLTTMAAMSKGSDTETRTVLDLLFGVTQVIDRSSLLQLNFSLSQADGYMTDPYKIVSVVDSVSGEPIRYLYENRPDNRYRQSVFAKYKKMFAGKDIFTASYRYMTDDWGVDSNTFDLTYRFRLGASYYLQPHLRYYQQSAADFYRYFLVDGEAVPGEVSADYRLGEMDATTTGIKFGREIDAQHSWSIRLERYLQTGESSPSEAFGQLTQQDLYPDLEATIVQFNYSFVF